MKYLTIIILFTSCTIFAQVKTQPRLKENKDSIITLLEQEINSNINDMKHIDSLRNDIKNQLIIYKAKEDYFSVALEDQSNRFALIITGLLAFLSFISFSWYVVAKRKINSRFQKFTIEFKQMKDENQKLESSLSATAANSFVLIEQTLSNHGDFVGALTYSLSAVKQGCKCQNIDQEEDYDYNVEITNLKTAIKHLDKIKADNENKSKLEKVKGDIIEMLDFINKSGNEEIKDFCAEIRITIKNYLK